MSMAPIPPKRWASEQPQAAEGISSPDTLPPPPSPQPINTVAPPPAAPPAPDPNRPIPPLQAVLADIPRQDQLASHDKTTKQIALVVVIGFFVMVLAIFGIVVCGRPIDATGAAMMSSVMSIAIAGFGAVIGFYFGSSAGSAQKTTTINTALTQAMSEKGTA